MSCAKENFAWRILFFWKSKTLAEDALSWTHWASMRSQRQRIVENVCATSGHIQPASLTGHASTGGLSVLPLLVTLSQVVSQTNLFHDHEDLLLAVWCCSLHEFFVLLERSRQIDRDIAYAHWYLVLHLAPVRVIGFWLARDFLCHNTKPATWRWTKRLLTRRSWLLLKQRTTASYYLTSTARAVNILDTTRKSLHQPTRAATRSSTRASARARAATSIDRSIKKVHEKYRSKPSTRALLVQTNRSQTTQCRSTLQRA